MHAWADTTSVSKNKSMSKIFVVYSRFYAVFGIEISFRFEHFRVVKKVRVVIYTPLMTVNVLNKVGGKSGTYMCWRI